MTTLADLADELDVTRDTIDTVASMISDDPDLFRDGQPTPDGADLIREHIHTGVGVRDHLTDLAAAFQDAVERIAEARVARVGAVRRARELGASWRQIADAFGLASRSAAVRIAGEDR